MAAEDDPLYHAEEQMIKQETEALSALFRKVSERLGVPGRLSDDELDPLTDAAVARAFEQTITEDPEAREIVGRLAVLQRFRMPEEGGD